MRVDPRTVFFESPANYISWFIEATMGMLEIKAVYLVTPHRSRGGCLC